MGTLPPHVINEIYFHMDKIEKMFKEGVKITVYIHNPDLADGDLISSSEPNYREMHKRMGEFIERKVPKGG